MNSVNAFICGGAEVDALRDIAGLTFKSAQIVFSRLGRTFVVANWDYRVELPETVEPGAMAARSLAEVGKAQLVFGIFGDNVPLPIIARQEVERACQRKMDGEDLEIRLFMRSPVSAVHRDWVDGLKRDYGLEFVWAPYETATDFQRVFYAQLMEFLIPMVLDRSPEAGGKNK